MSFAGVTELDHRRWKRQIIVYERGRQNLGRYPSWPDVLRTVREELDAGDTDHWPDRCHGCRSLTEDRCTSCGGHLCASCASCASSPASACCP